VIQGSPEWLQARCGNATASEFASILAKGEGKMRAAYLRRIVAERLTGKPCVTWRGNSDTERGQQQEPLARMAYEARTGNLVDDAGFIKHAELAAGASPDGLVGDDGGTEAKSVIATVQVETLLCGKYPPAHKAQIQGNLWILEREWWDFISFCPEMRRPEHRLYVFRVHRDEEYIKALEAEVASSWARSIASWTR
jgi:hypothetical protein